MSAAAGAAARRVKPGLGGKAMALWKQGWNEIPEVMGAGFYGLIGCGLAIAGIRRIYKNDENNHRYKVTYIVMRPDDERVERIKKFEDSPGTTRTPASLRC